MEIRILFLIIVLFVPSLNYAIGQHSYVSTKSENGDFLLCSEGAVAAIYYDENDHWGAIRAIGDLQKDIKAVTRVEPLMKTDLSSLPSRVVIIGTIGKSEVINRLVEEKKLIVDHVVGQWESFIIQTVENPYPGVDQGLVIAGSDKRGTIFGIYDLSEQIGVSPWFWWADVPVKTKTTLAVKKGAYRQGPPSVKYRGIFLNDESNLARWSKNTFEGTAMGPETYKQIFELLLRLKGNFMWPAMHGCSDYFNKHLENGKNANDYGIVMGSSHCEPMLRNNVREWTGEKDQYDYTVNKEGVMSYWGERAKSNGSYESGWTLGMRGIHDTGILNKEKWDRLELMNSIIADQRNLLRTYANPDLNNVWQVYIPYKEALDIYNEGVEIPDDVTLIWPDDNMGYLRQVSSDAEKKRSGGAGVYYHISYLHGRISYLWVSTTPLSLIWEQMYKAYENDMHRLWVLNVGDLKPAELEMEFFINMGWDAARWNESNTRDFMVSFFEREFGAAYAEQMADIQQRYYQLNIARRPTHVDKSFGLNHFFHGDEAERRVTEFHQLALDASAIYEKFPPEYKPAFFELVYYPVRATYYHNLKVVAAQKSDLFKEQGRMASVNDMARLSDESHQILRSDVKAFDTLLDGKWNHMMGPGFDGRFSAKGKMDTSVVEVTGEPALKVITEGSSGAIVPLSFSSYTEDIRFVDIINAGGMALSWRCAGDQPWIKVSQSSGTTKGHERVWVSVDWEKVPAGESEGRLKVVGAGAERTVALKFSKPAIPKKSELKGYVDANNYVSIEAEHFSSSDKRGGCEWKVVKGLGRSGDSVRLFPGDAKSIAADYANNAPELRYQIYFHSTGTFPLTVYRIPTLNTTGHVRFAVALDYAEPTIMEGTNEAKKGNWGQNILENIEALTTEVKVDSVGYHTLRVWMVDPAVAIDKMVIETRNKDTKDEMRPALYVSQTGCKLNTVNKGFYGSGYVDYGKMGSFAQWEYRAEASGNKELVIRYSNGGDKKRPCEIFVNEESIGTLPMDATRGWASWEESQVRIPVKKGTNTIRVVAVDKQGGPNVDEIYARRVPSADQWSLGYFGPPESYNSIVPPATLLIPVELAEVPPLLGL